MHSDDGFLYCLDANTGAHYWTYDAFAAIWGSAFVADVASADLLVTDLEHDSVSGAATSLASKGWEIETVNCGIDGVVDPEQTGLDVAGQQRLEDRLRGGFELEGADRLGLTGVHDAGVPGTVIDMYKELIAEHRLTVRSQ